jgi:hypothetical protein
VGGAGAPAAHQLGQHVGRAGQALVGDAVVQHHHRHRTVHARRRGDADAADLAEGPRGDAGGAGPATAPPAPGRVGERVRAVGGPAHLGDLGVPGVAAGRAAVGVGARAAVAVEEGVLEAHVVGQVQGEARHHPRVHPLGAAVHVGVVADQVRRPVGDADLETHRR